MTGGSIDDDVMWVGYGGTGTFTQTGGSIGVTAVGSSPGQILGLFVGGTWGQASSTKYPSGTYTLGGSGLLVGGVETIGVSGTGTFNQNGGTNCFCGGGPTGLGQVGYGGGWDNWEAALILGLDGPTNSPSAGKAPAREPTTSAAAS